MELTENAPSILELLGLKPAPELSPVKRSDLFLVAQRMFDENGYVTVSALHEKCGSRIPGSYRSYQMALMRMPLRSHRQ